MHRIKDHDELEYQIVKRYYDSFIQNTIDRQLVGTHGRITTTVYYIHSK